MQNRSALAMENGVGGEECLNAAVDGTSALV